MQNFLYIKVDKLVVIFSFIVKFNNTVKRRVVATPTAKQETTVILFIANEFVWDCNIVARHCSTN